VKWGAKIIVSGTGGADIDTYGPVGGVVIDRNVVRNIGASMIGVAYQANGTGNYRLSSSSPAIDRGTSTSAPRVDLMMVARPHGAAIDIGAYEF
jgi:glutamate synthase domain-containing protein 3